MTTPAEQFWWLGPSVAGIAACLVLWFNWGQHKVRNLRMLKPCRVDLVGPGNTKVRELHAPPNAEFSVQLRVWPVLKYQQHTIAFGFIGHPDKKPVPLKAVNEFIKIGKRREQSPETNENHMLDIHDHYQIREDRHLSPPNNYTYGFLVRTREPGTYPILLEMITDSGEGRPRNSLWLTVDPR